MILVITGYNFVCAVWIREPNEAMENIIYIA